MPDTYGTRPPSFYASFAPDYLWEEDDETDRERQRREDDYCDEMLRRRRENK